MSSRTTDDERAAARTHDPSFLILTSLVEGEKHGYALMQDIESFSDARLGPGTVYGAITRLERRGLIEPAGPAGRRRPYRLTPDGAETLRARLRELSAIVDTATTRLARGGAVAPAGGAA